ncbi:MAG: ParB/RepB/Spo0J family partition protein [Clostridia bacterium]|nr:ParB/RepB/Spo0J family partition protein [Clostridia bacterium]
MEGSIMTRVPVTDVKLPDDRELRSVDSDDIETLADSLVTNGQLQPLLVRKTGEEYELIAGYRRLLAAQKLNMTHMDVIVIDAGDADAEILSLVENLQREQLHYLDIARALKRLVERYGYSQDELSRQIGVSQSCIANRLRLNKLPDRVREKLMCTSLTERHARALLRLENETSQVKAIEHCESQKLSVRQFEAYIDRVKAEARASSRFRVYLRDHRMLINAVLNTVKSLNAAGVRATSRVMELDDRIEVVVSLPLNAGKRPA